MRWLLKIIGKIMSLLYPYKVHQKIKGGIKILYTAWVTSDFYHCGDKVKFGFKVHIAGSKHIMVGRCIFYGDGGALTAFAINGITPPRETYSRTYHKDRLSLYVW